MEEWRNIDEYEGLYQVSNYGRVKSLNYNHTNKERILKPGKNRGGYLFVIICKNGKLKRYSVHRLVAQAFIDNPYNLPQINHKDENPSNNRVENLEWCDAKYNLNYNDGQKRRAKKRSKTVFQYTMDGEFIREWKSAYEVKRQLRYSQSHINACCLGKRKSAYKYIWKYT